MRHLLLAIALAACAPFQAESTTKTITTADGTTMVCKEETPTGTNFSRRVCRTPQQMEDDRRAAEELLRTQVPRGVR